ncbi:DUF2092 domain-containing protein [Subtercola vilae]|uniref:DUF2092 domain-containing protein n=1 Tax=Subtercola vilae TaxID=2056433 RepID=A0A4V4RH86_9MICO|nr:DUF2092 domain-containing protein [Subtercola vilae]TIH39444.1 DUF2092 domain-containing protein [Subtercola vilae]
MVTQWKRWIPAGVASVVVAGVAIAVPLSANATAALPSKTAEQVIALVTNSSVTAFSGTVQQSSNLGLPSLPAGASSSLGSSSTATPGATASTGGSGSTSSADISSALELLTGSHTARVYVDGPTNVRVQVLDQLAERDVIRGGTDLWAYDSSKQTAVHSTLPAKSDSTATPTPTDTATPDQLAQKFLDAVDPSTGVAVGGDVTVDGRSAYDLVLTPATTDSLVGNVSIAVDSATGLPLQVEVTAKGASDPAFSSELTGLSLDTPSADLFSFTPPAGTAVTEKTLSAPDPSATADSKAKAAAAAKPVVTGTGWSSIVELPAASGSDAAALTSNPLVAQLTTPVTGGRLLSTTLVNVLLTTDGRVFAGSVSAEQLEAAAAATPAAQ